MFATVSQELAQHISFLFYRLDSGSRFSVYTLSALFGALLLWRFVKFTLIPSLRPEEPRELPYWIPFVGHAISFFKDQERLLTYGRTYFGTDRQPFAMTLAGSKVYILSSAHDIAAAYKNNTTLSFNENVQEVMRNFGLSADGSEKMWRPGYTGVYPNPTGKCLSVLLYDLHKVQLHPGKHLEDLTDKFVQHIESFLRWDTLPPKCTLQSMAKEKKVSLMGLCQEILVDVGSRAVFGDLLVKIQPDLAKHFLTFDSNSWQLIYQIPPAFAKEEMYEGKRAVVDALKQYFDSPREQRQDASWLVLTMETEMRQLDMKTEDMAIVFFMLYWLVNVNAYKSTFWLLSYALFNDPGLLYEIQQETAPAVNGSSVDLEYLSNKCPRLDSLFNETVRMTNSATSVRNVISDTVINGRTYMAGTKILMPYRQLHFQETVFGGSPNSFDPERFLRKKDLVKNVNYKPFGGGSTLCSGRFIAKREVVAFIALLLNRFDLELPRIANGGEKGIAQQFPRFDYTKPGLGIMDVKDRDDLVVTIRRKQH